LADVLFGAVSPAGRLVQTWASSIEHLPPMLDYNIRNGHTYMYNKHTPLFPFGYGLSYTTFAYSNLKLDKTTLKTGETLNITFDLQNTGNYDSDEVAQLYVSFPDSKVERPAIALKGFKRVFVPKGQTVKVTIPLRTEDLKYWNTDTKQFTLVKAKVKFSIGTSSVDFRLSGEVNIL